MPSNCATPKTSYLDYKNSLLQGSIVGYAHTGSLSRCWVIPPRGHGWLSWADFRATPPVRPFSKHPETTSQCQFEFAVSTFLSPWNGGPITKAFSLYFFRCICEFRLWCLLSVTWVVPAMLARQLGISEYFYKRAVTAVAISGQLWTGHHTQFLVDNLAVMTVLQKAVKHPMLTYLLRYLSFYTDFQYFQFSAAHIPSSQNTANTAAHTLSRDNFRAGR